MSTAVDSPIHPVSAAVDDLRATLDKLACADLWTMTEPDLLETRAKVEAQAARLTALRWAMTREIDTRAAAVSAGATSTTAWLVTRLRQAPAEAAGEVRLAAQVSAQALPATHAALRAGQLSAAAVAVIADTDHTLARYATAEQRAEAEHTLAGHAATLTLPQLKAAALRVAVHLDPDQGTRLEADERKQHDEQHLHLRRNGDGSASLRGYLGKEAAALLTAALDPLARPRPARAADGSGPIVPDPRSPARRTADALLQLVELALRADQAPVQAGQPVQVVVTIGLDALRGDQRGVAALDDGVPLSMAAVRRLACDAALIPVVLGADGQPLDVGRATRLVSPALRRALAIRDGGCAFPGCDRPIRWTQAHHVQHWSQGGPTTLGNLVLLCGQHHRVVHHDGWHVHLDTTDRLPTFTPPAWIDPDRRPRRNTRLRT